MFDCSPCRPLMFPPQLVMNSKLLISSIPGTRSPLHSRTYKWYVSGSNYVCVHTAKKILNDYMEIW